MPQKDNGQRMRDKGRRQRMREKGRVTRERGGGEQGRWGRNICPSRTKDCSG